MGRGLVILSVAGLLLPSALADTLLVPSDHVTIQAAVDAASDGDRIEIAPGFYHESVQVSDKSLTLVAPTGGVTVSAEGWAPLVADRGDIDLIGIEFLGGAENGDRWTVHLREGNFRLTDCTLRGGDTESFDERGGGGLQVLYGESLTIVRCDITAGNSASGEPAIAEGNPVGWRGGLGIRVLYPPKSGATGSILIEDSTVQGGDGGTPVFHPSTDRKAGKGGYGAFIDEGFETTVERSTFLGGNGGFGSSVPTATAAGDGGDGLRVVGFLCSRESVARGGIGGQGDPPGVRGVDLIAESGFSCILRVPEDFTTVQQAINAARANDRIILEPGLHIGPIGFGGKELVLRSTEPENPQIVESTILHGLGLGSTVTFAGTEGPSARIEGITITGGASSLRPGGIDGNGARATLRHCVIRDNIGHVGGGIRDLDGLIERCRIIANAALGAEGRGGGLALCDGTLIECDFIDNSAPVGGGLADSTARLSRCIFYNNSASQTGSAIAQSVASIDECVLYENRVTGNDAGAALADCGGSITHSVIFGNAGTPLGAALSNWSGEMVNTIVWGNDGEALDAAGTLPRFCDLQDWTRGGQGNISADPLFSTDSSTDPRLTRSFHLTGDSPCLDAGTLLAGFEADPDGLPRDIDSSDDPRGDGSETDIGAWEFLRGFTVPGDFPNLPSAVAAAAPGDTLLALDWLTGVDYQTRNDPVIVDKNLTIRSAFDPELLFPPLQVEGGVHLRLQDIRFEHRLTCSQSVIELTRCEFLRRSGPKVPRISAEQSLVTLIDTKLDGYAGGPGFMDQPGGQGATAVSLNESTLILIGSVVRGGSGESSYTYDFTENCDPPPGGPGGLGILANAGDISVLDSNVEGGRGGNGASCLRGPTGMAGPMGCAFDIDAATRVTLDGAEIVNGPDCPPVAGEIRLTPQRLLAHLLGLAQLTAAELQFTDPNGDGKTDIADVVWLQQN